MKIIDMTNHPRRAQFDYFRSFDNPYVSVTANADITRLHRRIREQGWPFFLTTLYCAVNAIHSVPELRRRIVDGAVVEYETCISSHTVALPNGSYCYCELDCRKPFDIFLPYALEKVELAKQAKRLEDSADAARLIFTTCLPWLSFTSITLPTPSPADSNVRLSFGKFFQQDSRVLLPTNLTVNHALADGIHIARFFESFSQWCAELSQ